MQAQTLAILINDPLLMPCVAAHVTSAVELLAPEEAAAVGVGRFERGDPLVAKVRPPLSHEIQGVLRRTLGRLALVSSIACPSTTLHPYDLQPFRYRNWLFSMAGAIRTLGRPLDTQLAIPSYIEKNIRGATAGEVLFHQFLAYLHRQGLLAGERLDMTPLRKALASALSHAGVWFGDESANNSMFLSDGRVLLGAALERPVYVMNVEGIEGCMNCGGDVDGNPISHPHVRGVITMDTDGLPSEQWQTVDPGRTFHVDRDLQFESFPV
jgi:hypothetical protein